MFNKHKKSSVRGSKVLLRPILYDDPDFWSLEKNNQNNEGRTIHSTLLAAGVLVVVVLVAVLALLMIAVVVVWSQLGEW